jgi:phage shock protein A
MSEENNNTNNDIKDYVNDNPKVDTGLNSINTDTFESPIISNTGDDDTKIENLTYEDAYDYVASWIQEQKRLERTIAFQDVEIDKWTKRVLLAEQKGLDDLVVESKNKLIEVTGKKQTLINELNAIKVKTDILKDKLQRFPKDLRTVDADALLMDIEHLLGKSSDEVKTDAIFQKFETQNMLEKLKAKMNEK